MDLATDNAPGGGLGRSLWQFGRAELDDGPLTLRLDGQPVELDRKTIEVLHRLLSYAGEVVTREEIFGSVWSRAQGNITDGVLTNAISRLRKLLGDEEQTLIVTHPKVGYRYAGTVHRKILEGAAETLSLRAEDPVLGREHWRLVRPLGRGGQGEVWLAEHRKTREQRVFKFAIDGTRLASLKREVTLYRLLREVLGERPDFARVLEWNFEQSPFFLECEFGGAALQEWADAQGGLMAVPLPERLRLLAETAEAVAAAHSAGVLHKDLKPGNVLIYTGADGRPHPRLTDFGSSRLADASQLAALGITRLGFTVTALDPSSNSGTPLYLAPELMAGQLPTVQSDVYALGVMLYQLIVGDLARPLAAGWEQEIDDELLRKDVAAAARGDCKRRLSTASELRHRLTDLEIRKSGLEREKSLAAQAALLEQKRRMSARLKPWRRAVAGILVAGTVTSLLLAISARRSAEESRRQLENTSLSIDFIQDLLTRADPSINGSGQLSLAELLRDSGTDVDRKFTGRPALAGRLHLTLASILFNRGAYDDALAEYSKAVENLERADADLGLILKAKIGIDSVQSMADDAAELEDTRENLAVIDLDIPKVAEGQDDLRLQWLLTSRSLWLHGYSDAEKAAFFSAEALELAERKKMTTEELLSIRRYVAFDQGRLMHFDAAIDMARMNLVEARQRFGMDDLRTNAHLFTLGTILARAGRSVDADSVFRQQRSLLERLETDPSEMQLSTAALGWALSQQGRWREAQDEYQASVRAGVEAGVDTTSTSLLTRARLAQAKVRQGDRAALREISDLLKTQTAIQGADFWLTRAMRYAYADAAISLCDIELGAQLIGQVDGDALQKNSGEAIWPAAIAVQKARIAECAGQSEQAQTFYKATMDSLIERKIDQGWIYELARTKSAGTRSQTAAGS